MPLLLSFPCSLSQRICFCLVFLLSLSSVVGRVSARLNSSDFGRVSTRSAISWDKTPLFGYAVDRIHCLDIMYVYNVNTVGVLSIEFRLLIIYWYPHCLPTTDCIKKCSSSMATICMCATCSISDTIISHGDPGIIRAGIPKGTSYDNFVGRPCHCRDSNDKSYNRFRGNDGGAQGSRKGANRRRR